MSFRTLLVAKAMVCLFFGVFLLAAPATLFGLLGGVLGKAGQFAAREYGAAMLGILCLTWLAKDARAPDARRAILSQLLVYDAIGVIITVAAVLAGTLNLLGWGVVAVYLLFTLGSALLLYQEASGRVGRETGAHETA